MPGGRLRGEQDRSANIQKLVRMVGKSALAAMGMDQTQNAESWRMRWHIAEWVMLQAERQRADGPGTLYENARSIYRDAAYYAKCSPVTAERWVSVWTCPASPFKLVKDLSGWIITVRKREDGEEEA